MNPRSTTARFGNPELSKRPIKDTVVYQCKRVRLCVTPENRLFLRNNTTLATFNVRVSAGELVVTPNAPETMIEPNERKKIASIINALMTVRLEHRDDYDRVGELTEDW